jgi:hypothetical protein
MSFRYQLELILFAAFCLLGCVERGGRKGIIGAESIDEVLIQSTEMMIHDVSNPPQAMRFYAYTCLAGYEVISSFDSSLPKLQIGLNEYPLINREGIKNMNPMLSSILCMANVSSALQPSGNLMKQWRKRFVDSCRNAGWTKVTLDASSLYAEKIADQIIAYAKKDGYRRLSGLPKYTPRKTDGTWYPTPPGYFPAVEPYFSRIRPFTLDTFDLKGFDIPNPIPYDTSRSSNFYAAAKNVYETDKKSEGREIAAFWDCNPFALSENGHLLIGMKKISPGAHWMGIAGIVCRDKKLTFERSMLVRTVLSIALLDGFWLCWREKYHSERIRPESAIRILIDPAWKPFLQTPPFPEYPSGHSVVSSTASVVLGNFFGDKIEYTDSVERRYGIADRSYDSFQQAANEAGLSRFYGGIHFMDAITNGQQLGVKMAFHALKKMGF